MSSLGILSIKRPGSCTIGDVVNTFESKVYLFLFLCVLLASLALRLFANFVSSSPLCRRALGRQILEMALLVAVEPRTNGLIREKRFAVRIIIAVLILSGFVMRKNFGAKLNAIFAFRNYDYVKDFGDSLRQNKFSNNVIARNQFMFDYVRKTLELDMNVILDHRSDQLPLMRQFLQNEAVFVDHYAYLKRFQEKFDFLPLSVSKCGEELPICFFPIVTWSRHFKGLYRSLQLAFDHGIYRFAQQQTDMYDKLKSRPVYVQLFDIFERSWLLSVDEYKKESNVLLLCKFVVLGGTLVAIAALFWEIYKKK